MKLFFTIALTLMMSSFQETQFKYVGDWEGELNIEIANRKLPLVFKIREVEGKLTSTLDSPSEGAAGIKFDKVSYVDGELTLTMTAANATFKGKLEEDKLVGKWAQNGYTFDLTLTKVVRKGKS